MDHPSDSDESDVDFVPDEKETSDVESDTEGSKESSKTKGKRSSDVTEPVIRSKRLRGSSTLDNETDKKDYVKTDLNHSVDKNYEDDLWKTFLTPSETKTATPSESKSTIESKQEAKALEVKKQDNAPSNKRPPVANKSSGLSSVLNKIGKGNKLSTLEKSKLDWNSFKKDEGIEEELTTHNRGREGYLERQDFLQRTDLRQFEIEKNVRAGRRGCS